MSWNPEQYERFKDERKQPFRDLVNLLEHRPHMRIVDLGCGTGELTRELHQHLAAKETIGIDNSETMLLKSDAFGAKMLRFERGDIEAFVADDPFDLIFSNAALQWVPDHAVLLRRLASFLSERGQIAIQMPANDDHPSHAVAADTARSFGIEPRRDPMLRVEEYASLLYAIGFKRQHVRLQVYGHELASPASVIDWVKGTLLTDYERRLGDRYPRFLEQYSSRLLSRLGEKTPYFYTYKRILMWGTF
ncbi:MAG TPA: methyltransferase domain-containing protein [Thermoanaerobaculia bacterium]|nr:methyltransferase domain-containing protein [Thermoanaerobaculia bacterium]